MQIASLTVEKRALKAEVVELKQQVKQLNQPRKSSQAVIEINLNAENEPESQSKPILKRLSLEGNENKAQKKVKFFINEDVLSPRVQTLESP